MTNYKYEPNPTCCRSDDPRTLCPDCRDLLRVSNFDDDMEDEDDQDDDYEVLGNAEDEDEIEDDHLVAPALNWSEIRAEERRERAEREQAFNSRSPRSSAPTQDEDPDLLIPPSIDWAAERRAGR